MITRLIESCGPLISQITLGVCLCCLLVPSLSAQRTLTLFEPTVNGLPSHIDVVADGPFRTEYLPLNDDGEGPFLAFYGVGGYVDMTVFVPVPQEGSSALGTLQIDQHDLFEETLQFLFLRPQVKYSGPGLSLSVDGEFYNPLFSDPEGRPVSVDTDAPFVIQSGSAVLPPPTVERPDGGAVLAISFRAPSGWSGYTEGMPRLGRITRTVQSAPTLQIASETWREGSVVDVVLNTTRSSEARTFTVEPLYSQLSPSPLVDDFVIEVPDTVTLPAEAQSVRFEVSIAPDSLLQGSRIHGLLLRGADLEKTFSARVHDDEIEARVQGPQSLVEGERTTVDVVIDQSPRRIDDAFVELRASATIVRGASVTTSVFSGKSVRLEVVAVEDNYIHRDAYPVELDAYIDGSYVGTHTIEVTNNDDFSGSYSPVIFPGYATNSYTGEGQMQAVYIEFDGELHPNLHHDVDIVGETDGVLLDVFPDVVSAGSLSQVLAPYAVFDDNVYSDVHGTMVDVSLRGGILTQWPRVGVSVTEDDPARLELNESVTLPEETYVDLEVGTSIYINNYIRGADRSFDFEVELIDPSNEAMEILSPSSEVGEWYLWTGEAGGSASVRVKHIPTGLEKTFPVGVHRRTEIAHRLDSNAAFDPFTHRLYMPSENNHLAAINPRTGAFFMGPRQDEQLPDGVLKVQSEAGLLYGEHRREDGVLMLYDLHALEFAGRISNPGEELLPGDGDLIQFNPLRSATARHISIWKWDFSAEESRQRLILLRDGDTILDQLQPGFTNEYVATWDHWRQELHVFALHDESVTATTYVVEGDAFVESIESREVIANMRSQFFRHEAPACVDGHLFLFTNHVLDLETMDMASLPYRVIGLSDTLPLAKAIDGEGYYRTVDLGTGQFLESHRSEDFLYSAGPYVYGISDGLEQYPVAQFDAPAGVRFADLNELELVKVPRSTIAEHEIVLRNNSDVDADSFSIALTRHGWVVINGVEGGSLRVAYGQHMINVPAIPAQSEHSLTLRLSSARAGLHAVALSFAEQALSSAFAERNKILVVNTFDVDGNDETSRELHIPAIALESHPVTGNLIAITEAGNSSPLPQLIVEVDHWSSEIIRFAPTASNGDTLRYSPRQNGYIAGNTPSRLLVYDSDTLRLRAVPKRSDLGSYRYLNDLPSAMPAVDDRLVDYFVINGDSIGVGLDGQVHWLLDHTQGAISEFAVLSDNRFVFTATPHFRSGDDPDSPAEISLYQLTSPTSVTLLDTHRFEFPGPWDILLEPATLSRYADEMTGFDLSQLNALTNGQRIFHHQDRPALIMNGATVTLDTWRGNLTLTDRYGTALGNVALKEDSRYRFVGPDIVALPNRRVAVISKLETHSIHYPAGPILIRQIPTRLESGGITHWLDQFISESDADARQLNADPDLDGWSNLLEYAHGLQPDRSDSPYLATYASETENDRETDFRITFDLIRDAELQWSIESASEPGGTWEPVTFTVIEHGPSPRDAALETYTVVVITEEDTCFLRMVYNHVGF